MGSGKFIVGAIVTEKWEYSENDPKSLVGFRFLVAEDENTEIYSYLKDNLIDMNFYKNQLKNENVKIKYTIIAEIEG